VEMPSEVSGGVDVADEVRAVTESEVEFFRENGWVHLPSLISADLAHEMFDRAKELLGFPDDWRDADWASGPMRDAGSWHDYGYVARDHKLEPFRSLVFSSPMGSNSRRLMSRNVPVRYWSDSITCKIPATVDGGSQPTTWHQDFPHYSQDRVGGLMFWIAMDDVPAERGSLRFLSGSQRGGPLGRVFKPLARNNVDLVEYYEGLDGRYAMSPPLDLAPGDATCHGGLTVHSAPRNMTGQPRWAFMSAYFPADTRYTGAAYTGTDGLGLTPNQPFEHDNFPLVPG
jgi:hypothetical protein